MLKILIVNNAEPGITEFTDPLDKIVAKAIEGLSSKFRVKQMHNDSITLPEDFELLATSKTCKVQLMKHKQLPLYTSQFHPEFYNTQLIRNFLLMCNKPYLAGE
jgi:GMP synthase-like glutamine amidotransferase